MKIYYDNRRSCLLTDNGISEGIIAANAAIEQVNRILMTQVCRNSIDTGPSATFRTARIDIQDSFPRPSFLGRLDCIDRIIIVDGMFAAEYVEVAQNNAGDIRWSCISIFVLRLKESKYTNEYMNISIGIITNIINH